MSFKTNNTIKQLEVNITAWELCILSEEQKIEGYKQAIRDAKSKITSERRKMR